MRDPITEDDWDATVQSMRDKFLAKFITDIVAGTYPNRPRLGDTAIQLSVASGGYSSPLRPGSALPTPLRHPQRLTYDATGSHKAYPAHEVPLLEARARFCDKVGRAAVDAVPTPSLLLSQLPGTASVSRSRSASVQDSVALALLSATVSCQVERAVKLAMSKFARINVVYTLFGKTRLDNTPVCVACDRPFSNDAGRWLGLAVRSFPVTQQCHSAVLLSPGGKVAILPAQNAMSNPFLPVCSPRQAPATAVPCARTTCPAARGPRSRPPHSRGQGTRPSPTTSVP